MESAGTTAMQFTRVNAVLAISGYISVMTVKAARRIQGLLVAKNCVVARPQLLIDVALVALRFAAVCFHSDRPIERNTRARAAESCTISIVNAPRM
jgi:hypothetical protein